MKPMHIQANPARQSGTVLLVAIVLLLLAGVMTLAALNVGVFEQRSTGNDIRSKEVNNVAEAGLAQGFEYLMRQHPDMMEDDSLWVKCGATETTYPCGAVSADLYDDDADSTTAAVARRSTMFRLNASGHTDSNFDSPMPSRMLAMDNDVATTGNGTTVAYGVAPVLCYVASRLPTETANSPIRCASSRATASDKRIVTFVSVARLPGEGARTTLTQSVGRYTLINNPAGKPPVIASGSVDITGTLQVVTNPNAGGAGVPVTVWTRKDVAKTGTPNTCYADEFFRFGAKNNSPPTLDSSGVILCDDCQCQGDKSLSYDNSGNVQDEGIDILDVDAGTTSADRGTGANYNVKSDSLSWPVCEFPPDLFAYIFGVNAWTDVDHDCVAEQKIVVPFTNPNNGNVVNIGADEAYLYTNAAYIINATTTGTPSGASLRAPGQVWSGGYPSSALSGLIWCQSNCNVGSNTQLGTPANPVVLVVDGSTRIQGRVFGLIFLRTQSKDAGGATVTLTPAAGYTLSSAEIAAGGNATLDMNAGSAVYGSVVVQGQVQKANGTAAIIYDATVLGNIGNNPNNNRFSTLPGAWNDISSY